LLLAEAARLVCGLDESSRAIGAAKQNARRNGISNCRFLPGDVVERVAEAKRTLGQIDRLVVNPPRKGIQPAALAAILALEAPLIIYVSCEPKSLCRDLDKLIGAGYRMEWLQPFDMFPHTEQVETVALVAKT
jgi:23S rRNA (uracil1939-C5)-methyltransferase